jgi:hypothetical protein
MLSTAVSALERKLSSVIIMIFVLAYVKNTYVVIFISVRTIVRKKINTLVKGTVS